MAPKHDVELTEQETTIDLGPLKVRRTSRWLNAAAIAAVALANHARAHTIPSLSASAVQTNLFEEVTGEDILRMTEQVGGTAHVERDEEGLITSITASIPTVYEYDTSEMEAVIDSLYASATPKKLMGDLAQTSVGANIAFTGTLTTGSANVTAVSSTVGLVLGQTVTGTGVAAGTTIATIGSGTITLSVNATANGAAVALTAAAEQQIICLAEWTLDWKRKTADATTTDDAAYESSIASTKSWSVKAKFMFVDSDPSQSANILAVIDTLQVDTLLWTFFPTVELGRLAFQGYAIIDGITFATGIGKTIGLDVSLKGTGQLKRLTQLAPATTTNTVTGVQGEV